MPKTKSVKTYNHGIINVGSCQYFNYITYAPAGSFAPENEVTVLNLSREYDEVMQKPSITRNRFNGLTSNNKALTYDWTNDIAEINASSVWLWGSYAGGGVGLIHLDGQTAFIVSNGYYTSVSNPQVGRYYVNYTQRLDYSANRMSSVMIAYFNYRQIYASIINPLPDDLYSKYIRIIVNYDSDDPTNQNAIKYKNVVPSSEYSRGYYYDPGEMPWTECFTTAQFDNTTNILDGRSLTQRWIYPDKPQYLQNGSYWNNSTSGILDDDLYGVSGLNHESGHWYGEEPTDDEGGDGDEDDTQDPVPQDDAEDIPTNILDTGFFTLFKPVSAELRGLANFMFAQLTDDDANALKKLLVNPLDYITCLNCCHFAVPVGDHAEIKVGGIGTTVQSALVTNQFVTLDGGSYTINEYWGNYLDYAPYTKIQIHIPYAGTHDLDVDLVMRSTLKLKYQIDLLSGSMVAVLSLTKNNDLNNQPDAITNSVIETYTGNVFSSIPIASTDYRNMLSSVLGIASNGLTSLVSGNPLPVANGVANAVTNSKTNVTKQGSVSNSYGYISPQNAYLIISRPCLTMGESEKTKFHDWLGYPCNMVKTVEDFRGVLTIQKGTFWSGDNSNSFDSITDTERDEIETLMESGICV